MKTYIKYHITDGSYTLHDDALPIGVTLTKGLWDAEHDYLVVDVSHWDEQDKEAFGNAPSGDQLAQLEGLLENIVINNYMKENTK